MDSNESPIPRRRLLKNAALLGVGAVMDPLSGLPRAKGKTGSTLAENEKPGTLEWQLQYTNFDEPLTLASYPLIRNLRSSRIEGYVSETSYYPGERIEFKVSLNPAGKFLIDIYRLGYYGGMGGRHMTRVGAFAASPQPMPMMTIERLRECKWETATTFAIPNDWPGGVYLGKLSRR